MPNTFMIDLLGTELSQEERMLLKHPQVGAVILFTRNFTSPTQLQALTESIRHLRPDIFIATDQEGGYVQRFQRQGFAAIPPASVYGRAYDQSPEVGLHLAKEYGKIMANDLLSCGVDLSLAPVLDVAGSSIVIGKLDRSFHQDPEVVACLASAFIEGMHSMGMPCVGKHFPGHGGVHADSHVEMPISEASEAHLYANELKPFIELIQHQTLDGIMPAHVTYRSIDPHSPAGFSTIWLQRILRQTHHFSGLIISDCLSMTGADIGDLQTRAHQAIAAGCDMLIVSHQPRSVLGALIQHFVREDSAQAEQRIEAFKKKMRRFSSHQAPLYLFHSFSWPPKKFHPSGHVTLNRTDSV